MNSKLLFVLIVLTAWSVIIFVIGFTAGNNSAMQSLEKEVIELNIELTKLEIKKLNHSSN